MPPYRFAMLPLTVVEEQLVNRRLRMPAQMTTVRNRQQCLERQLMKMEQSTAAARSDMRCCSSLSMLYELSCFIHPLTRSYAQLPLAPLQVPRG